MSDRVLVHRQAKDNCFRYLYAMLQFPRFSIFLYDSFGYLLINMRLLDMCFKYFYLSPLLTSESPSHKVGYYMLVADHKSICFPIAFQAAAHALYGWPSPFHYNSSCSQSPRLSSHESQAVFQHSQSFCADSC